MKKPIVLLMCLFVLAASLSAQIKRSWKPQKSLVKILHRNLKDAAAQYKVLMYGLPPGRYPKTYYSIAGKLETSNSGWWCSGFYSGTLLRLFEQTKDSALYREAMRSLDSLKKEQFNKNTHDLGFMMYCSFGTAYSMHPSPAWRDILINSARSLSTRFNAKVGCIRSWDSKKKEFLVIIDNMMNLELLCWATRQTGDSSFYKIAVAHANTTMKNHFRPDYSSYHVVNYNAETGAVQQKRTAQGAADSSAWARGQAWGLYGYTMMYRETKDPRYLAQACHIANFILKHPNLPADKIPYWDFNAPGIPGALRDASAAAVMASAFIELSYYGNKKQNIEYINAATTMLQTLSNNRYKAAAGTNGGFLLQHCVGHMPEKKEIDAPLSYADYYYVEAMRRYLFGVQ